MSTDLHPALQAHLPPPSATTHVSAADVLGFVERLGASCRRGELDGSSHVDRDAELVDRITALEILKSAASAEQAVVTAEFAARQRQARRDAGEKEQRVGKGIGAQVALARKESPFTGSRLLGLAEALVGEMPHTLAALRAGDINEWRATVVTRETACLSREDRARVDAELAQRPGGMATLGDATIGAEARRIGYRLSPHAYADRARKAASDRCVTIRPAPDTMTRVSALLPVREGVAVINALRKYADQQRADGDERGRGQLMADTLTERVTGLATPSDVPLEVHVVVDDDTLFGDDPEPADVLGYGPVPAPLFREWLRESEKAWLRRLYRRPGDGALVAMDKARRLFEADLRQLVVLRDKRCRTPWCDAPIRHADHIRPASRGGPTSADNGQGLCEACNYAKEAVGWSARLLVEPSGAGTVETTTPTGHRYRSHAPPILGPPARSATESRMELFFRDQVLAYYVA